MRTTTNNLVWRYYQTAIEIWQRGTDASPCTCQLSTGSTSIATQAQLQDHLGGNTIVTDSEGDGVSSMRYHPYGKTAQRSGVKPVYGFAGGESEEEEELGLVQCGARWYAPEIGRWVSADPLYLQGAKANVESSLEGGLYSYAANDPLFYIDKSGEKIVVAKVSGRGWRGRFRTRVFRRRVEKMLKKIDPSARVDRKTGEVYFKQGEVAKPKFYWFDTGVLNAAAGAFELPMPSDWQGVLLEHWVYHELKSFLNYHNLKGSLGYWRTESGTEVDFIWWYGDTAVGIEVKSSTTFRRSYLKGLTSLSKGMNLHGSYVIYQGDEELRYGDVQVLPVNAFLKKLHNGKLFQRPFAKTTGGRV